MSADVVVYTTAICPYCVSAKALLRRKGVTYREIGVDGDADKRRWLAAVTGQRTVPQIFIDDVPIGGFSDMVELDRQGRLDPMLAGAPRAAEGAPRS